METPVCLIENAAGETLCVNDEALQYLMQITQPVVVVAVVGLYRTGKSYLMNKLAGGSGGFALGSTIQSKTKGIWMWCVPHPRKPDHTLLLLDTEGLGDVEKGDQKNDAWIFALAILLSSTLVYNSRGVIDNQALEHLQYVTELTERIKILSSNNASSGEDEEGADAQFVRFFPSFVWAVRDFTLLLEIAGRKMTEDDYLEHALTLKKGRDRKTVDYNLPRECIRNYFPTRRCFVFETPAAPDRMCELECLDESELSPVFSNTVTCFCTYIYAHSGVKKLQGGQPVTGRMLGRLAKSYVDAIVSGSVPCLENAVLALAEMENTAAVEDGLNVYRDGMAAVTMPTSLDQLSQQHAVWENAATRAFMARSFKDKEGKHLQVLVAAITEHYSKLLNQNENASEDLCWELLDKLSEHMDEKLQAGVYAEAGGYNMYSEHHDSLVAEYRNTPNKGVKAEEVLDEFLKQKSVESSSILHADKNLSEKEREIHEEKSRTVLLEQEARSEAEKRMMAEKHLQDQESSHQDNIRHLQEKWAEEAAQREKELQSAMESKLQEQKLLMAAEFKEKQEMLREELHRLQTEQRELQQQKDVQKCQIFKGLLESISQGFQSYYSYKEARELHKQQKPRVQQNPKNPTAAKSEPGKQEEVELEAQCRRVVISHRGIMAEI